MLKSVLGKGPPRFLFWANLFGPETVKQLGSDFVLGAPGWKKERLSDGAILYVVESRYRDWYTSPSLDALRNLSKE